MPYLSFSSVSDAQFSRLNPSACAGFTAAQVSVLRIHMTAACLSNLTTTGDHSGCSGLVYSLVSQMDPQAFRGFTSDCINATHTDTLMYVNATQLAALEPTACAGFRSGHICSLPNSAAPGLTKQCLAHFSTANWGGACAGLQSEFVQDVPATTFQGFTAACISSLYSFVFTNITVEQIQNIPAPSFAGFGPSIINWMPQSTVMAISVEQLSYLTQMGFVSLFPEVLGDLINQYQLAIVNRWTLDQVAFYGEHFTASKFPSFVVARVKHGS